MVFYIKKRLISIASHVSLWGSQPFPQPSSQTSGADSTVFVCQGVTAEESSSEARVAELVPLERHLQRLNYENFGSQIFAVYFLRGPKSSTKFNKREIAWKLQTNSILLKPVFDPYHQRFVRWSCPPCPASHLFCNQWCCSFSPIDSCDL